MTNAQRRRSQPATTGYACRCRDCLCSRLIEAPAPPAGIRRQIDPGSRCDQCERGKHAPSVASRNVRRFLSMRQRVRQAQKAA